MLNGKTNKIYFRVKRFRFQQFIRCEQREFINLVLRIYPSCLGKTVVYSAGVTVMAGFPVADRFLTADCRLLIHCRKLAKTVQLDGPLSACEQQLREVLAEIETGKALQTEGYRQLIEGSQVTLDEIERRAADNWYLTAEEALARGLIAGVV